MSIDADTLFTTIIGVGGATFIAAIVKAYRDIRNGARVRDRDTVGSLREQRDDAEARTREVVIDRDFYMDVIGRLVYQLRLAGVEPDLPPGGLVPPSHTDATVALPPKPRRRRPPAAVE